jgi:FHS family L-fucose permease-like MFS transporter
MAVGTTGDAGTSIRSEASGSYVLPMVLMVALYFSIGFITALNDILIPHFKDLFHLTNVLALLVDLCFFGAYFVMSLPSGWIVGKIGYKTSITAALSTMGCGLLLFVPASIVISYPVFLFALFVVGSGLALLQVAINPYVGALGKPETASSRLNLCGGLNSLATTIAPKVGAAFIFIAAGATTAQLARSVRMPYVIIAGFTFLVAIITRFVHLPELIEKPAATSSNDGSAWGFTHLRLGAAAIFTYVGVEVAIGSILINFLGQPSMGSLSHVAAAGYVSLYWGGAMVGRFIGSFALIYIRAERALAAVAISAVILVAITVFGHGHLAMWAIVVHLPAVAARSRHVYQPRFRNSGDDGCRRSHHSGSARAPRRQVRLSAQFPDRPSLLRVPCLLRLERIQGSPAAFRLAAKLCTARRNLTWARASMRS